ncbi:MAG: class I SAM-dependent methyltransferase [Pseudomonas sp.]
MRCGHRWRLPLETAGAGYYETLVARNDPQAPWFRRKIAERVAALSVLLESGVQRVLEVGCAEGELGAAIKARFNVVYDGVELSRDREIAEQKLDQVFQTPASQLSTLPYELIASFHVLEHIAQPEQELAAWSRLLSEHGRILIEVPNRSGHPLLGNDHNPEHLHQFTSASLTILLARCGFDCHELSVGHYESPVYSDSLRVVARAQLTEDCQKRQLIQRFRDKIDGPFAVYGIGGDFLNYVAPLAQSLDIQALLDSSPSKWGQHFGSHSVGAYDEHKHKELLILVCSIRFVAEIKKNLIAMGIAPERIIGLESIYELP